jgi:SAM-dependent methyltransferase
MPISSCRSCGSSRLLTVLDLGRQPIANALLGGAEEADPRFPLGVAFCEECTLLQVTETVPPDVLYKRDYPYFSSASPALLDHARRHVEELIRRRGLGPDSLVIEVASNDGYLLKNFVAAGIPVLGIDPADGPAQAAARIGVPTINDFFSTALAEKLRAEGRLADVTLASNVVAHVDGINDFVGGFARILKPDGTAIFEFAYAVDMIEKCEFDTIYHEHLFYHTLHGIQPLLARHGLHLNDAQRLPIHGGSLRIHAGFGTTRSPRLEALLEAERRQGVAGRAFYLDFERRVAGITAELTELLGELKRKGARIACYGAAAKGATLINTLDLGVGFFDYVVDRNGFKQGKLMPGQKLPIRSPEALVEDRPDYVLLLAWNFAEEVIRQNADYLAAGGRFIIPVPKPMILASAEDLPRHLHLSPAA